MKVLPRSDDVRALFDDGLRDCLSSVYVRLKENQWEGREQGENAGNCKADRLY